MNSEKLKIDPILVRHLVAAQFPQWKDFSVRPITMGGWDNRTFRLGETMLVRMPSAENYAVQVEKEQWWLPKLAPFLPLAIPIPLAMGEPAEGYPWKWSIYRWIEGETATSASINLCDFATSLAQFLRVLQHLDPTDGPQPGLHNFYRGGSLRIYQAEAQQAITALKDKIDVETATQVWETALAASWHDSPVWIHGDVSAGNLLVQEGRLSAVIDFGMLAVGDPACDLTIAWTLFEGKSREVFRTMLPLDPGAWARGRAWTLWKAMITAARLSNTNTAESSQSWRIINEVLTDHRRQL